MLQTPKDFSRFPWMEFALREYGQAEVAGVSGTAAPVRTDFSATVGASLGGGLFPTGNRSDVPDVPGR